MPPTPEHKSHTGVKIFNLDLYGIFKYFGMVHMFWAWPEWVGSMKLGFSDGLGGYYYLSTKTGATYPGTFESHTGVKFSILICMGFDLNYP